MGPTWPPPPTPHPPKGLSVPDGPHVGSMCLAIRDTTKGVLVTCTLWGCLSHAGCGVLRNSTIVIHLVMREMHNNLVTELSATDCCITLIFRVLSCDVPNRFELTGLTQIGAQREKPPEIWQVSNIGFITVHGLNDGHTQEYGGMKLISLSAIAYWYQSSPQDVHCSCD